MGLEEIILKRFWQHQEKYVYYLIALSVTAIGYAIVNTKGEPLKWAQIPLGLSIISWAVSIYCGLSFLRYIGGGLSANKDYLVAQKVGLSTKAAGIRIEIESISDRIELLGAWQDYSFYSGITLYLLWHIIEMYLLTIT